MRTGAGSRRTNGMDGADPAVRWARGFFEGPVDVEPIKTRRWARTWRLRARSNHPRGTDRARDTDGADSPRGTDGLSVPHGPRGTIGADGETVWYLKASSENTRYEV